MREEGVPLAGQLSVPTHTVHPSTWVSLGVARCVGFLEWWFLHVGAVTPRRVLWKFEGVSGCYNAWCGHWPSKRC